jgi:hypothetical protein
VFVFEEDALADGWWARTNRSVVARGIEEKVQGEGPLVCTATHQGLLNAVTRTIVRVHPYTPRLTEPTNPRP